MGSRLPENADQVSASYLNSCSLTCVFAGVNLTCSILMDRNASVSGACLLPQIIASESTVRF